MSDLTGYLPAARVRIGLGANDTTKDTKLTVALNTALLIAERYCDRKFLKLAGSYQAIHFAAPEVQLDRYPVNSVTAVTADGTAIAEYHVNSEFGRIVFDGLMVAHVLSVTYDGGYQTLPPDLELALWLLFDAVWPSISTSGVAAGSGAVKAIRSNGSSVEYDTSGGGVTGMASIGGTGIPVGATTILDSYRLVRC